MSGPGRTTLAGLAALALLATATASADPPPHAKAWGHPSRQAYYAYDDRYYRGYDDRHDHDHDDCDHGRRRVHDVYVVRSLPYGYRHIDYRGDRYYYDRSGRWYVPHVGGFTYVAPPAGLVIDSRGIAVVARVPVVRW